MLTAIIVNDHAAKEICPIYDSFVMPDLKEISKIIDWVCEYHDEYSKAPKRDIENIFHIKSQSLEEDEQIEISKFLTSLSQNYSQIENDDFTYVIREAKKLIHSEIRKSLAEELAEAENQDDIDEIIGDIQRLSNNTVDENDADIYNPFDYDVIFNTIMQKEAAEPLFSLPGVLAQLVQPTLVRGGFVNFQGEEKVGKTWWLLYLFMMALRGGNRTVFFQAGDMTSEDFNKRLVSMVTRTSTLPHNTGVFNNVAMKDGKRIIFDEEEITLAGPKEVKEVQKFNKRNGRNRAKVATYSNGTLNAALMDQKLSQWYEQEGYVPDVAILDYADIMGAEPGTGHLEGRHRINHNWMALRALSQKWKILLITASQGSKDSRDRIQSKRTVTEDKRKDSHITASFGLSNHSSFREKCKNGDCFQINQLYNRHGALNNRLAFIQRELRKGQVYVGGKFVDFPN